MAELLSGTSSTVDETAVADFLGDFMKASLVTSCTLAAALLLTGCSGGSDDEPKAGRASASAPASVQAPDSATSAPTSAAMTSAPASSVTAAAPVDVEAPNKAELEARVTALTDELGDPFQLVSAEQAAAGLEIVQSAMEGADIQPAECKDHATGNAAASADLAAGAVSGVGAADSSGGYLAVVVMDGSTEDAVQQGFNVSREALEKCAEVTATIQGNTITSITEEVPLDLIGEESFALRVTQELGGQPVFHNLSVTARGNGVIANVQAMSQGELDGVTQDLLADLSAKLLEPAGS